MPDNREGMLLEGPPAESWSVVAWNRLRDPENRLVYGLYGLTEEEIAIVEEGVR